MKKNFRIWIYLLAVFGAFLMLAGSCKKSDDSSGGGTSSGTVKDIDGNVYNTVTIGTQVWMVENLKTTKYRNGDAIPNVTDGTAWRALNTGAYCNFYNDVAIATKYGKLYNWYAVNDSRKIAPAGWHVPTDVEWTKLETYMFANLGNSGSIAKALASTTDWASSTKAGSIGNDLTKNNLSGFSALPGGARGISGNDHDMAGYGVWWSSTEYDTDNAWYRPLGFDGDDMSRDYSSKVCGFSVRCVKD